MDLGGVWRATAADEKLRRTFHEVEYDDSTWSQVEVPGHWAEVSELADEESVLYRYRFTGPNLSNGPNLPTPSPIPRIDPQQSQRWWLRFEGLAQQGHVWLDDTYLDSTDGYFVPHEMEITKQVLARCEHVLAVEATCQRFGDPDNRTTLTGALQDPELVGSDDLIIGGLWRPVSIRSSGPIAIRHSRVVCSDVRLANGSNPAQAKLALRAVLDVPNATTVNLRTRVAGIEHIHTHSAAAGENRVEWTVNVADPELWWPHALGDQPLHDLTMETIAEDKIQDFRRFRIGFRKVSMKRWVLRVNGERLHLKGANLLPTRTLLGTASSTEVTNDIRAARSAELDLVRPITHIARPELYEAADELGMLIWQDLPVRGLMNRNISNEAHRQAREAVDLLGHHPSLVIWCAHDEPFARPKRPTPLPPVLRQQNPSWNRDVLDRWLCRILNRCDGSRPVVAHTAAPPRLSKFDGTTLNVWLGRHGGRPADLGKILAKSPRMGRFVSAFGTPIPTDAAEVAKTTIETLRRLKYRPNGGFLFFALADVGSSDPKTDGVQAAGFGALDGLRHPRPAWEALVNACRPLIVIADPMPPAVHPGSRIDLAVHVVNDRRDAMDDMIVQAQITGPDGLIVERRWTGAVAADECVFVGRIEATVPQPKPSNQANRNDNTHHLSMELELRSHGEVVVENRSRSAIL